MFYWLSWYCDSGIWRQLSWHPYSLYMVLPEFLGNSWLAQQAQEVLLSMEQRLSITLLVIYCSLAFFFVHVDSYSCRTLFSGRYTVKHRLKKPNTV